MSIGFGWAFRICKIFQPGIEMLASNYPSERREMKIFGFGWITKDNNIKHKSSDSHL